jgi:hypothetical protein
MSSNTTTTTTTKTTRPSLVTVLSLLDDYATHQEKGNAALKQSLWNLYKARHFKSGQIGVLASDGFQASDVREELRARVVLRDSLPDLVDERTDKSTIDKEMPRFVLVDTVLERQSKKGNTAATQDSSAQLAAAFGLRNRKATDQNKNNKTDSTKQKEWSVEMEATPLSEEDRLLAANPLELFGAMPPRELYKAQEQAKQALQAYVAAANLIVAIQQELRIDNASKD